MSKIIELKDAQAQKYLEYLEQEQERLLEEIVKLEKEWQENDAIIASLAEKSDAGSVSNIYDETWVWSKKIIFVLRQETKALSSKRIVEIMAGHEPSLTEDEESYKATLSSISSILSAKSKSGKLFGKYQSLYHNEYLYGLIEWFNDGRINREFNPDLR